MHLLSDQRSYRLRSRGVVPFLLIIFALAALAWRTPAPSAATSSTTVFLPLITRPIFCFPTQVSYPISVRSSYLNENGFVDPDSHYSDEIYKNKTMKRIYMQSPVNPNGGFSWLSWRAGTTLISFTASLSGTGSLAQGFDEAPWPPSNSLNLPKPPEYPFAPHQLNAGDWVYKYPGSVNVATVRAALDHHIANRTLLFLPINDTDDGEGVSGTLHVNRAGAFLLRGYTLSGIAYLDLVYIEQPALTPCRN